MEYIEIGILDEKERKEKVYISKYGSLLQPHHGTDGKPRDYCTNTKNKRIEYVQSALNLN